MAQVILVVDDDHEIVRLLRAYLERDSFSVITAYNGEEALHAMRRERPDLVILDLMMPERDGWNLTRLVRADSDLLNTPLIIITARNEEADRILGLELGADDYVTKPFSPREVVARVRAVLRRSKPDSTNSQHRLRVCDIEIDMNSHIAQANGQTLDLTPSEYELLRVLMQNPGHAFTRLELIEQSLGYAYEGMERTVDSHIKNLRRKLGGESEQKIETVYGVGYRLRAEK